MHGTLEVPQPVTAAGMSVSAPSTPPYPHLPIQTSLSTTPYTSLSTHARPEPIPPEPILTSPHRSTPCPFPARSTHTDPPLLIRRFWKNSYTCYSQSHTDLHPLIHTHRFSPPYTHPNLPTHIPNPHRSTPAQSQVLEELFTAAIPEPTPPHSHPDPTPIKNRISQVLEELERGAVDELQMQLATLVTEQLVLSGAKLLYYYITILHYNNRGGGCYWLKVAPHPGLPEGRRAPEPSGAQPWMLLSTSCPSQHGHFPIVNTGTT